MKMREWWPHAQLRAPDNPASFVTGFWYPFARALGNNRNPSITNYIDRRSRWKWRSNSVVIEITNNDIGLKVNAFKGDIELWAFQLFR